MKINNGKKVFVGLSGGVDSSVSAYILKKEGYDVTGVFIKVWQPSFLPCTWREDRLDAMRVAAKLNIPFITLDLEKEYKKEVIDYMIKEYKEGRTPNPDVFCNKEVKFGAFLKWALKEGADFVATGHYAQKKLLAFPPRLDVSRHASVAKWVGEAGRFQLLAGKDQTKDQSYFLWTLTEDQLKHIIFPIGHLKKTAVRKIAKQEGLMTADKKDSQGLCFISNVDMKQFLKHFIKAEKGRVFDEGGNIIGEHSGAVLYTLGERHDFVITKKTPNDKPYFVIKKDLKRNSITVSDKAKEFTLYKNETAISELNIRQVDSSLKPTLLDTECLIKWHVDVPKNVSARLRHLGKLVSCTFTLKEKNMGIAKFESPQLLTPGQSIVFYDKDICLGGGIIK